MSTPTSKQILDAAQDSALRDRLVALAARLNKQSPQSWVDTQMHAIVSKKIDGSSLAEVYAYAAGQIGEPPMGPGEDPQYVTDALIEQAIQAMDEPPAA